jgi:acyl-CoA synthetase (NDP forming)
MGTRAAKNLARFKGRVFLISSRGEPIDGQQTWKSVAELPETPDCVVVAVPRDAVEGVLDQCAARGVKAAVVFASNYAEAGDPEGARLQDRLAQRAHDSGMRIAGPNTIGLMNMITGAGATFAASAPVLIAEEEQRRPEQPKIGLVSQSGGVGFSLSLSCARGVAFSHVLTTGNSVDIDIADYIAYLAEEPGCRAIACLFEGMPEPARFMEAAEIAWRAGKPLVVHKIATGESGAQAAISHTGMLAGSAAAYSAMFERLGVVPVDNLEALIETAGFFARAPKLKSKGVAVATSSGGLAVMCADKAEQHAIDLPQPSERTRDALKKLIPDFGSPRNPCDVTAQIQAVPTMLAAAGEAFLAEPEYGALIVTYPTPFGVDTRIKAVGEVGAKHEKMVVNLWTCEWLEKPEAKAGEQDPHGALFRSIDRGFAALGAWHAREDRRIAGPRAYHRVSAKQAAEQAAALIKRTKNRALTEREAKEVLALYGVPVVGERLTGSKDEAIAAARALGFPAALKVESPDLPHKTEAGVIRLNLKNEAEVAEAYSAVMANAEKALSKATGGNGGAGGGPRVPRINGVLVQPMAGSGIEIMIGARDDPQFGPLVVAGLGGVLVELLKDTAVGLAPVTQPEALAMLGRLKGKAALTGFRGAEPVDRDALADVICRLSEFAADQADLVAEFDVNPLICAGTKIVAVDALIVKKEG